MTPHGLKVLSALAEGGSPSEPWYFHLQTVADATGFTYSAARRIVRYLARKGYAEYAKGLWTEEGRPAGAGYCITSAGRDLLAKKEPAQ